jgi:hypothetical protein
VAPLREPRCALLAAVLAAALCASARAADGPAPGASLSEFVEGTHSGAWGRSDTPPVEVPGEPGDVRFEWPKEAFEPADPVTSDIRNRVLAAGLGVFSIPRQGHVGDDPAGIDPFPSYRDGWNSSIGGALQIGFDANAVGFFLDLGFQTFRSKGMTVLPGGAWYRFSDIRITTICPGFKLQFPSWLKLFYAGDTDWELSWYDYMLHSFPFVKFGVGPVLVDSLELRSAAHPDGVKYWDRGLSYTFFLSAGMEWRPFGRAVSLILEAGIQAFVFTTETAYTRAPDRLVSYPVKLGISVNF